MEVRARSERFYDTIPVFDRFSEIINRDFHRPLPGDWFVGIADVVQSTQAIRANRYKAVNMAGASVIAALSTNRPLSDAVGHIEGTGAPAGRSWRYFSGDRP